MWYLIILIIIFYIILNLLVTTGSFFESYILQPIFWIIIAIITLIIAKSEGLNILKFKKIKSWNLGKTPVQAGLLLGGFQVALLIIVGLLLGFGKSPFSLSPSTIIINTIFIGTFLIGAELSRAYLIKKSTIYTNRYITIKIVGIAILYMFLYNSLYEFSIISFQNPELILKLLGTTIIPIFSMNLLATYLSFRGGSTASMAYISILLGFEWFSPIGPNPHWMILALFKTIAPAIGFLLIQESKEPLI